MDRPKVLCMLVILWQSHVVGEEAVGNANR